MKKKLLLTWACIILFTLGAEGKYTPTCIDIIWDPFLPKSQGLFFDFTTGATLVPTIILYVTFSMGPTTASTVDCPVYSALNQEEKEQLIFMAFNHDPVMRETAQRNGEFVSIAMDAMGCAKRPEVFYDALAENFDEVFREKEYGLAYAIRANRVLSRQKICEQNGVRRFLTAMDTHYSKEYPDFPRLPPEVIRQSRAELQKIAEEYNQRFSPEKAGKK